MHIGDYLAALALVNEEREGAGLPPLARLPRGFPLDPRRCVIANAIPGSIVYERLWTARGSRELPPAVVRFIGEFDLRGLQRRGELVDPCALVDGSVDEDKGCLVPA